MLYMSIMNRPPIILVAIFAMGFTSYAQAVSGTLAKLGAPDFVCRILAYDEEQKLVNSCSGSLTGKNEISTAAHCVSKAKNEPITFKIGCGYQGESHLFNEREIQITRHGGKVLVRGVKFKEEFTSNNVLIDRRFTGLPQQKNDVDTAKIILDHNAQIIQPVRIIKNLPELLTFFSRYVDNFNLGVGKDIECEFSGFGGQPNIEYSGTASTTPVGLFFNQKKEYIFTSSVGVRKNNDQIYFDRLDSCIDDIENESFTAYEKKAFLNDLTYSQTFDYLTYFGDSGGPLYCRTKNSSKWIQVGVQSELSFESSANPILPATKMDFIDEFSFSKPLFKESDYFYIPLRDWWPGHHAN
jgi:hypothetical protein